MMYDYTGIAKIARRKSCTIFNANATLTQQYTKLKAVSKMAYDILRYVYNLVLFLRQRVML